MRTLGTPLGVRLRLHPRNRKRNSHRAHVERVTPAAPQLTRPAAKAQTRGLLARAAAFLRRAFK